MGAASPSCANDQEQTITISPSTGHQRRRHIFTEVEPTEFELDVQYDFRDFLARAKAITGPKGKKKVSA